MNFTAETAGGGKLELGEALEVVMSYDRDAPADGLRAVFTADGPWEELIELTAWEDGRRMFRGIVDEQSLRLLPEGFSMELVCRSREAILLDNEAEPRPLQGPSLELLAAKILEPLGFTEVLGDRRAFPGELSPGKGSSCWAVLEGFCRERLGTVPYVDLDGAVHCEAAASKHIRLGAVMSAEMASLPVKRLSDVWKQGYRGGYDTRYCDSSAPLVRRRYISAQSGRDPKRVLQESRLGSSRLTVNCAGNYWPEGGFGAGALADVSIPRAGSFTGRPVANAVYYRDSSGERTKMVLERGREDVAD